MSELYTIVIQRKLQSGQVGLHYKSRDAANNALAAVREMAPRLSIGGVPKHKLLQDDFGNKVDLDPIDIGNICFIDIRGSLEQSALQAEMTNKLNAEVQEKARREQILAQTKGGIMIPHPGEMTRA